MNSSKRLNTIDKVFISGLIVFGFIFAAFRPVHIPPEKDCRTLTGKVLKITEGGVKDVNFKLEGHKQVFYVNRGLERGLNLRTLNKQLVGRTITLKYPEHWSLLNFNGHIVHVSKVELDGKTIFTELME